MPDAERPCRIGAQCAPGGSEQFSCLLRGRAIVAIVEATHNRDGNELAFARRRLGQRRFPR